MSDPYDGIAAPIAQADPYAGLGAEQPQGAVQWHEARAPNGKRAKFALPSDATDDEIKAASRKALGVPDATNVDVRHDGEVAPDTSSLRALALGALKPIDNAAAWLDAIPGVHEANDAIAHATGVPTTAEANASHDQARAANTRTGYQTLGNIAGTLPVSALPGGLATQGAASGALLSDAHDLAGTALDAGKGALGAVVGGKALQGLGALATGVTDKGLRALNAAGVPLTLGQIASAGKGVVSKAISKGEEGLTSVFGLGDMINMARGRGTEALNVGLGNRILANVGEKLPAGAVAGHDMIDAVQSKLSSRYTALTPKLVGNTDQQFATDLQSAADLADQAGRKGQLGTVVNRIFGNRFNGQAISGQQLKDAESELTRIYGKYKNAQGDEGLYGEAIDGVRQALRGLVMRSNPGDAAELQGLNKAWAQLKALRSASQSAGNNATGVATPAAALRAFTKGGYRDPLLETAKQVLPNTTPDSGTARRAMIGLGTLAAGGSAAGVGFSPALAIPAAGSLLYTKAGQTALNAAAFASRPAAVRAAAVPLNALSRYAPQAVTPLLVGAKK